MTIRQDSREPSLEGEFPWVEGSSPPSRTCIHRQPNGRIWTSRTPGHGRGSRCSGALHDLAMTRAVAIFRWSGRDATPDRGRDRVGGGLVVLLEHVRVDRQGHDHGRVPQSLGDHLRRHSGAQCKGRRGVS